MKRLSYPFSEKEVRSLKAGDAVLVSGKVFTGRDRFTSILQTAVRFRSISATVLFFIVVQS